MSTSSIAANSDLPAPVDSESCRLSVLLALSAMGYTLITPSSLSPSSSFKALPPVTAGIELWRDLFSLAPTSAISSIFISS